MEDAERHRRRVLVTGASSGLGRACVVHLAALGFDVYAGVRRPEDGDSVIQASANSLVDPWLLGSKDERDVQGYAGTPVSVNELTFDFGIDIGAAGASFPKVQRFYVSVDSGSDDFTHQSLPGGYVLRSWVNDVTPPSPYPPPSPSPRSPPCCSTRST